MRNVSLRFIYSETGSTIRFASILIALVDFDARLAVVNCKRGSRLGKVLWPADEDRPIIFRHTYCLLGLNSRRSDHLRRLNTGRHDIASLESGLLGLLIGLLLLHHFKPLDKGRVKSRNHSSFILEEDLPLVWRHVNVKVAVLGQDIQDDADLAAGVILLVQLKQN